MHNEIECLFARVFQTPAGKQVMDYLRQQTVYRVLGADSSDAVLRFLEGQRFLVRQMENLIQRGQTAHAIIDKGEING